MHTRICLRDLELAWRTVDEAERRGRGALERTSLAFGVSRAVVMDALNRVEKCFGQPLFVVRVRRTGKLTRAGRGFHGGGKELSEIWQKLHRAFGPTPIR